MHKRQKSSVQRRLSISLIIAFAAVLLIISAVLVTRRGEDIEPTEDPFAVDQPQPLFPDEAFSTVIAFRITENETGKTIAAEQTDEEPEATEEPTLDPDAPEPTESLFPTQPPGPRWVV